jgi:hypothetical protein
MSLLGLFGLLLVFIKLILVYYLVYSTWFWVYSYLRSSYFLDGDKDTSLLYMIFSVYRWFYSLYGYNTLVFLVLHLSLIDVFMDLYFYMTTGLHGACYCWSLLLVRFLLLGFMDSQTISHSLDSRFSIYYYHHLLM